MKSVQRIFGAAPAPGVQGTPTKEWPEELCSMPDCANNCVPNKRHCELHSRPAPVETPQKETPIKWPCTGCGDSHAQGEGCFAPPAPEGVQGKEPQTFDEFWANFVANAHDW